MDTKEVVAQIDRQIELLHRTRSAFPRVGKELIGDTGFSAPDYFKHLGYDYTVTLTHPINKAFVDGLVEVAHWINENFIVRLNAVLEGGGVLGKGIKKRKSLPGWDEVEMVLRLRNQIAHGFPYEPNNSDHVALYTRIVTHFNIKKDYSYLEVDKYPLGIAAVLVPLAEGCKRYAAAFIRDRHQNQLLDGRT